MQATLIKATNRNIVYYYVFQLDICCGYPFKNISTSFNCIFSVLLFSEQ